MLVSSFSQLEIGDIAIPIKNPLISVMKVNNFNERVIVSKNKAFVIDELVAFSDKCIRNPNLNIEVSIKVFGQIPIKTKFIYDNSIYTKIEIDTGDCKHVKAFDLERHTIRAIFSSEEVFVIEGSK